MPTSTVSPFPQNVTFLGIIVGGINCDTVEYVQRYSPVVLMQVLQSALCYASVFLIIIARAVQQHAYFHPNFKVLLATFHGTILMFSFSMGTAQLYHVLTSFSYEYCELLISCKLCFGFRLLITTSIIMFSLLLLAIPIERCVATRNLGRGYENRKASLGQVLSLFSVIFSLFYSSWYHWTDMSTRTCSHCVYDYRDLVPPELMKFLAGISTVSLLYTLIVLVFNMCKLKKKTYSLAIEFQINQNLRVLHLILPISMLTFLVFTWYSTSPTLFSVTDDVDSEVRHFHKMVQNMFPAYTFLSSVIWLSMMYSEKKKKRIGMMPPEIGKDEKDVYFQSLNDQWSRMPSQKSSRLQILSVFSVPRSSMAVA